MRPSEYIALTWADFDLERNLKRRKERTGMRARMVPSVVCWSMWDIYMDSERIKAPLDSSIHSLISSPALGEQSYVAVVQEDEILLRNGVRLSESCRKFLFNTAKATHQVVGILKHRT